eukprot:1120816-Prymnesium_polylepis.1
MCTGSAVMTTASTVRIFTVNPESIANAERRQHLIDVLDDSGATVLLTNNEDPPPMHRGACRCPVV